MINILKIILISHLVIAEKILNENKSSNNSSVIFLSKSTKFDYNEIENLIVFGDSHSDVNTNFTDMSYTGENHSLGKNWPLHLIEFNKMKLWNYAVGCSPIDKKLVRFKKCYKIDLTEQFKYFYENMSKETKFYNMWNKNNSLFAIWIGNIDIWSLIIGENEKIEIDKITNKLFEIINEMYNVGARNILIFNVFSRIYILNKNHYIKDNIQIFNNNIIKKSEKFFKNHPDTNIIIYNTIEKLDEIVSNCEIYKLKDCNNMWKENKKNNIKDYFWINSHMSDLGNKIMAEDINNLLNSINH